MSSICSIDNPLSYAARNLLIGPIRMPIALPGCKNGHVYIRVLMNVDRFVTSVAVCDKTQLAALLLRAVPEAAVIDTGNQRIVYREVGPGEYEGVLVELGPRMVGEREVPFYPVLRGLMPGDQIVTAGSFLIDAETRLNPAAGSIYFGGSSGSKDARSRVSRVRPSTPEDVEKLKQRRAGGEGQGRVEAESTRP